MCVGACTYSHTHPKMSSNLQLRLKKSTQEPYTVNSDVEGDVQITIEVAQNYYKKIIVALTGKAEVYFFHQGGERIRHFQQSVCFIQLYQVLWERDSTSSNVLPKGVHSFPFQFTLEGLLPSSTETKDSRIRYTVEAKLIRGMDSEIEAAVAQVHIPVSNIVDINRPDLLVPRSIQKDLTVSGCLCASGGTISVTATVSRSGYCVGKDSIPVSIEIDNLTNRSLSTLSVELVKRDICHANGQPSLALTILGSQLNAHLPGAGISFSWNAPPIAVPDTNPTLTNCDIIQIRYFIRVSFKTKYSNPQELIIPLILGNVPFNEGEGQVTVEQHYAPSLSSSAHNYEPPPIPKKSGNESIGNGTETEPLMVN